MHILLMILKIIGIILLVILGLLLAVILLVLLVPVRYRVQGSYKESPAGTVRVTWLLHALSALATYDGGLDVVVKVLGIQLFRLQNPGGEEDAETPEGETEGVSPEPAGEPEESGGESPEPAKEPKESGGESPEPVKEPEAPGQEHTLPPAGEEPVSEDGQPAQQPEDEQTVQPPDGEEEEAVQAMSVDGDESSIFEKAEDLFDTLCDKLNLVNEKRLWLTKFLENSSTQHTLGLLWRQLKKIILHVIPTKASGSATLGFDDPATTGQVLAACSVLYALYGDSIVITPDFERSVLEGDLDLKGRIRAGTIAFCAVRVLLDREFWVTLKRIKKYRENGGI